MHISKNGLQYAIQFICMTLTVVLLATVFSGCSPQPAEQSPTPQSFVEPTQTLIPPLPSLDGTPFLFEEGRYNRDEYCSRMFDYHVTAYGELTIAIADNLVEPRDPQELAEKVVERYRDLYVKSPAPMSNPITVFILSNPDVGECYSRDHLVFVEPDEITATSFSGDLLGVGTGNSEYWVKVGLTSLALNEQPDQDTLKTWYQNTDDLDMAGLFIARFQEDWATEEERRIARMSATSLVKYALDVEHIQPDRLVEDVNNGVRTRWLESFGVQRTVTYPHDGRFTGFVYSHNSDCSLIVQTDTVIFCLNRLLDEEYFDEISEAEHLIDHAYYGRKVLVEYLMSEAPSIAPLMDTEEMVTINVMKLRVALGHSIGDSIYIHNSAVYYWDLYTIVNTFNWNRNLDTYWLSVGFAEYLGKYLPIYPQTEKRCIFEELNGRLFEGEVSGIAPGTSYWHFLDLEQFEVAKEWYLVNGGQTKSEASVDPRLYADAVSFATIYRDAHGGARGIPIGEKIKILRPGTNLEGQDGLELSYTQAASFVAYLCDTYSIDRVLDVYVNSAEDGKLDGKTYEELKSDWLADLRSKGQGIDIPEKP